MITVTVRSTANYDRYVIEVQDGEAILDRITVTRREVIDTRNRLVEKLSEEYGAVEAAPLPELWTMPQPHEERGGG